MLFGHQQTLSAFGLEGGNAAANERFRGVRCRLAIIAALFLRFGLQALQLLRFEREGNLELLLELAAASAVRRLRSQGP